MRRITFSILPRPFIFNLVAVAVVIVAVAPLLTRGTNYLADLAFSRNVRLTSQFINDDLNQFARQANQISQLADVKLVTSNADSDQAANVVAKLKADRNLKLLALTDRAGNALSRATNTDRRGDNFFITTTFGRKVADGVSTSSIERSLIYPLGEIASSPVLESSTLVGGVITGRALDDEYAHALRSTVLGSEAQVIFYSTKQGVTGQSFDDDKTRLELQTFFDVGSEWLQDGLTDQEIKVGAVTFRVKNVQFTGLKGVTGGMLVLLPIHTVREELSVALMAAIIYLMAMLYLHTIRRSEKRIKHYHLKIGVLSLLILGVVFGLSRWAGSVSVQDTRRDSPLIYSSTLELVPAFSIFKQGVNQKVAVVIKPGLEAINAVEATIVYDPAAIEVREIDTAKSFCGSQFFLEKSIDQVRGRVILRCGLPTPGFSAESGTVAELVVAPKLAGTFSLKFDPTGTKVLANDGLGTNVLRNSIDSAYQATATTASESTVVSTSNIPPAPVLFSLTHLNSEQWYNSGQVTVNWPKIDGASYYYDFDQSSATVPTSKKTTSRTSVTASANGDGQYWFHVAAVKDGQVGPTSHLQVKVDTTAPDNPVILASQTAVKKGDIVRFVLSSNDNASGLQNNYYVRIDDQTLLPTSSSLFVPFATAGEHTVTVRAFDRADNYGETTVKISVTGNSVWQNFFARLRNGIQNIFD